MNFNGFGGGNMQNILKQAQKMQEEMQRKQEELENSTVIKPDKIQLITATRRVANEKAKALSDEELKKIKINPQAVDPDDVEMLEDLIVACVNDASRKVDELKEEMLGGLPKGMF